MRRFLRAPKSVFQRFDEKKYHIPTAAYENFEDAGQALAYLETAQFPPNCAEGGRTGAREGRADLQYTGGGKDGVRSIMLDKQFGTAGNRMVIEEFMTST